jgi:hypothetical protein
MYSDSHSLHQKQADPTHLVSTLPHWSTIDLVPPTIIQNLSSFVVLDTNHEPLINFLDYV